MANSTTQASHADQALLFEGVRVDGAITGLMLEVSAQQRFRNAGMQAIEVVYTFPLPAAATLLDVQVQLGERKLAGTVVDKVSATQGYEDALADGDSAILLEKNHDQSYSINLGNLAPGERCVATMRYAEVLQFEQGGVRINIPTVIAPRYGNPLRDAHLAPPQLPVHQLDAAYAFDLALRVPGPMAQARVGSPSHPVSMQADGDGVTVTLAREGALDRDFVLVLDQFEHGSLGIASPDSAGAPGKVAALLSFCPRLAEDAPAPLAVKLLVDCSGSMAGDSIAAAKRALHSVAASFRPGDRFALSRFGSSVQHRSRGLWTRSGPTVRAAGRWIDALDADLGGTEMEAALESTFALQPGVASDVLLMTDGQLHAIDAVIACAQASGQRVFVVAIGSSPAHSHLRRLALATGGACDFVAAGEAVEPAVTRMFARLRSPRLHGVTVQWPGDVAPDWSSALPDAVFSGDTVNVFAWLDGASIGGEVRLFGSRDDGTAQEIAHATLAAHSDPAQTLARIAAGARVEACISAAPIDSPPKAAIQLALRYQLVTEQTNFLLIHEREAHEKATDMPALHKVAQMIPAGWAGTGMLSAHEGVMQPAVWRREAASSATQLAQSPQSYDIPAFLRRYDEGTGARSTTRTAGDWSASDNYEGLTPLGLRRVLASWGDALPIRSYAALAHTGLGSAVIDWLEMVMGDGEEEAAVVRAFLFVISQDEGKVLRSGLASLLPGNLFGRSARQLSYGVDQRLAGRIAVQLVGMTARDWPPCVFAMEQLLGAGDAMTGEAVA